MVAATATTAVGTLAASTTKVVAAVEFGNATTSSEQLENATSSSSVPMWWTFDAFGTKLSLSVVLPVTVATYAVFAMAIWKKVQVEHPVFAVVFQEVAVLCGISAFSFAAFFILASDYYVIWMALNMIATIMARQFHQLSWMIITILRYYFLIHLRSNDGSPDEDVDMRRLRRRSLRLVWLLMAPLLALGSVAFLVMLRANGWPEIRYLDLAASVRFSVHLSMEAAVNLPDFVSVVVYLLLLRGLRRRKKQQVAPAPPPPPPPADPDGVLPFDAVSSTSSSSFDAGQGLNSEADNEETSVVRTLTMHAIICLLDMFLPVIVVLPVGRYTLHYMVLHSNLITSYWLPLIVISKNFKKMDEMIKFYVEKMC